MRCLNTKTLKLEDYPSKEKPEYAILSHRWEEPEVTMEDMSLPFRPDDSGPKLNSSRKIRNSCKQARDEGYHYIWIDTCCIDKKSHP